MAKSNYLGYKKKFNKFLKDKIPAINRASGEALQLDQEQWIQCYNPHDTVRKEYPKYFFVSNKGNIVSVFGNKPEWRGVSETSNGRESYGFSINGDVKHSISYIIVAVCFGSKTFGKADELMKKKGREAFGKVNMFDLNVNHEEGFDKEKGRAYNNNPETLEILTINIHQLFKKVPSEKATASETIKFMSEMSKRIGLEGVEEPVILIPGSAEDSGMIDTLDITEEQTQQLREALSKNMLFMMPIGDSDCKNDFKEKIDELQKRAEMIYKEFKYKSFEMIETSESGQSYTIQCILNV